MPVESEAKPEPVTSGAGHREKGERHVVLIEPKTTLNTGNVRNERTVEQLERL
jgi:hypothetical protein